MDIHTKLRYRNLLLGVLPGLEPIIDTITLIRAYRIWRKAGFSLPLPNQIKRCLIKSEARRMRAKILVETGTYMGDTPWFFRNDFAEIHSIEVEPVLARIAADRFRRYSHVHIHQGDSANVLGQIVPRISDVSIFWLDGHYSGGITGKGRRSVQFGGARPNFRNRQN